jgi:tetratricopeptide (TPR) repeat protein
MMEELHEELLRKGLEELGQGNRLLALSFLEKSFRVCRTSACDSFLGYLIAQERGRIIEGLSLCNSSLEEEPENPIYFLNLGRVLYKADRKREAIDTVRRALYCGPCPEAEEWLNTVGIRRRPVFPFLPRKHLLNKYVGLLLSRLGLRKPS